MLRLLVRSAPGVRAMSSLLTIDTGVDDSAVTDSGEAATSTFCSIPATFRVKRKTAALPEITVTCCSIGANPDAITVTAYSPTGTASRSEEHTSELQSQSNLVCRLLLEKKKKKHSEESHCR